MIFSFFEIFAHKISSEFIYLGLADATCQVSFLLLQYISEVHLNDFMAMAQAVMQMQVFTKNDCKNM